MNGNVEKVGTVIIGGGHAGLTMSCFLLETAAWARRHTIFGNLFSRLALALQK